MGARLHIPIALFAFLSLACSHASYGAMLRPWGRRMGKEVKATTHSHSQSVIVLRPHAAASSDTPRIPRGCGGECGAPNLLSRAPPSYIPAPHIINRSFLTAQQIISHFQDFYANLEYVSCAPALVFDRVVGNLNEVFNNVLEQERLQHNNIIEQEHLQNATALERERAQHAAALDENRLLRLSNEKLRAEIAELKRAKVVTSSQGSSSGAIVRPCAPGPAIGAFRTSEVRPWNQPRTDTSKPVPFTSPYSTPPGLPIGLNMLNVGNTSFVRIHSHASNVKNDRFNINVNTWADTKLYEGGCTWLEIGENNTDFQFGTFNTLEDYSWDDPQTHHTRLITFPRPYSAPPRMVVWLTVLEMRNTSDWRVKTYETNVTKTGFTIHIESLGDSVLNFGTATWVAYPADRPGISSGRCSTLDTRPPDHPQLYNCGYVNFGNIFAAPPRVLLAINSLEISSKNCLRLKTNASNISATGMIWHIDSWDDTILYSAGASYIAVT